MAAQWPGLDADQRDGPAAQVGVPYDGDLGLLHSGPALERRVIAIDDGAHDRADVERLLAPAVAGFGEHVTDAEQVRARGSVLGAS